jgi:hypothetical protein
MKLQSTDLSWYKSLQVSDLSTNGGRLSATKIVSAIKNNILPDVTEQQRVSTGLDRYRKVFGKVESVGQDTLANAVAHIKSYTPGDDIVELFAATQIDTQADITGSEQRYGAGKLNANITAGVSTTCVMLLEASTQVIHKATGNTIYIGNGTNEEYHYNVAASKSGSLVTFTLDAGDNFSNSFLASNSIVATVLEKGGDLKVVIDPVSGITGTGTFNNAQISGNQEGTVEETWTFHFTSASNFYCVGAIEGNVGSGNITTPFAPTNTAKAKPFFTIAPAAWGGTWANLDEMTLVTHPSAFPVWINQDVPVGSASYSGNNFTLRLGGQSG